MVTQSEIYCESVFFAEHRQLLKVRTRTQGRSHWTEIFRELRGAPRGTTRRREVASACSQISCKDGLGVCDDPGRGSRIKRMRRPVTAGNRRQGLSRVPSRRVRVSSEKSTTELRELHNRLTLITVSRSSDLALCRRAISMAC